MWFWLMIIAEKSGTRNEISKAIIELRDKGFKLQKENLIYES